MLATWGAHGWGGGPWFLFFPLFWILVVVGLALFFRRRTRFWYARSGEVTLAESFARGEITEDEYRRRIAVLRERPR